MGKLTLTLNYSFVCGKAKYKLDVKIPCSSTRPETRKLRQVCCRSVAEGSDGRTI